MFSPTKDKPKEIIAKLSSDATSSSGKLYPNQVKLGGCNNTAQQIVLYTGPPKNVVFEQLLKNQKVTESTVEKSQAKINTGSWDDNLFDGPSTSVKPVSSSTTATEGKVVGVDSAAPNAIDYICNVLEKMDVACEELMNCDAKDDYSDVMINLAIAKREKVLAGEYFLDEYDREDCTDDEILANRSLIAAYSSGKLFPKEVELGGCNNTAQHIAPYTGPPNNDVFLQISKNQKVTQSAVKQRQANINTASWNYDLFDGPSTSVKPLSSSTAAMEGIVVGVDSAAPNSIDYISNVLEKMDAACEQLMDCDTKDDYSDSMINLAMAKREKILAGEYFLDEYDREDYTDEENVCYKINKK